MECVILMSWLLKYTLLEEERHRLHKLEILIDGHVVLYLAGQDF